MEINQHNGKNITKFISNSCPEYFPCNTSEIKSVLNLAKKNNLKIHPLSTGRNWGLGSKESFIDNKIIINLSKMDAIIECDEEFGFAVIEPGVTQEHLSKHLKDKNSNFFIDTTGSAKDTSIIGNSLERGVTYNGLRADAIYGLEVITGNMDIIKTGQWRFERSKTNLLYKHGVGPNLTDLFLQSNFGIVTKAVIKLKRRKKYNKLVQLEYKSVEKFSDSISAYKHLMDRNVIESIFHLANADRAIGVIKSNLISNLNNIDSSLARKSDKILSKFIKNGWIASGTLCADSRLELFLKTKRLKKNLSPFCKVTTFGFSFFDFMESSLRFLGISTYAAMLKSIKPFGLLYKGVPTDAALASVLSLETFCEDENLDQKVDNSETGFSYCLPITKLNKFECLSMVDTINIVCSKYRFNPSITLNPITNEILEAVVSLDYSLASSKKAHECISELTKNLIQNGHTPYRVDINNFDKIYDTNSSHSKYLKEIKRVFDPYNLIFPGRYIPNSTNADLQNTKHLS